MKITKFGHSCFFIEDGDSRILIDPGRFSRGFEKLERLDAILITHQHPDHLVPDNLRQLITSSVKVRIFADEGSSEVLKKEDIPVTMVRAGDFFEVAGTKVEVFGRFHEVIHPDIADITDAGYLVGGRFFHPGDAYTVPPKSVELLAAPAGAPWLRVHEAIDYIRRIKPQIAFPAHDAVLSDEGKSLHHMLLNDMGQAGKFVVLEHGKAMEF